MIELFGRNISTQAHQALSIWLNEQWIYNPAISQINKLTKYDIEDR
jgi:hypothetical protein